MDWTLSGSGRESNEMTLDPALIRTVEVRVTATRVGTGRIVPYDHHQGLQRQSLGPGLPPRLVVYAVPPP